MLKPSISVRAIFDKFSFFSDKKYYFSHMFN